MSDYGEGFVAADRQPENRVRCELDTEGYVTRVHVLGPHEEGDFLGVIRATRREIDPADVVMPPMWPVDWDGRGLSILEVTRGEHLTIHREARVA